MPGPRITKKLPSFEGVAASSTATCRLPLGFTYHRVLLSIGNAYTTLDEIRVVINGTVEHRYSAAELNTILKYYGLSDSAGFTPDMLVIPFDNLNVKTRIGEESTGIGTGPFNPDTNPNPVQTIVIEVDLDATAAPSLSGIAIVSDAAPAGAIRRVKRFTYTAGAAGEFQIADLPRGDVILAAHFNSANIDGIRLEKNGWIVRDRTLAENDCLIEQALTGRAPQTNWYHYDPAEEGHAAEQLFTADAQDMRFVLDMSAGGSITVLVEYAGTLRR